MTEEQRKTLEDMGYSLQPDGFWWRFGYSYGEERVLRSALKRAKAHLKILASAPRAGRAGKGERT